MPGRLRTYELDMPDGSWRIAVSRNCDLLVGAHGKGAALQVKRVALEYLASPMTRWMVAYPPPPGMFWAPIPP
jgi:hypothetical protein